MIGWGLVNKGLREGAFAIPGVSGFCENCVWIRKIKEHRGERQRAIICRWWREISVYVSWVFMGKWIFPQMRTLVVLSSFVFLISFFFYFCFYFLMIDV